MGLCLKHGFTGFYFGKKGEINVFKFRFMLSDRKTRVASLSILSNSLLIILKIVAGILSGSVSIISEAIHSTMDLFASIVAFFSVKESSKPADHKHPFGHGKIENISAIVEGLLIFIAAVMIIFESVNKMIESHPIKQENIAIIVMFISATVNFLVSRKLSKVAKEEDSMALEADSLHLKTDVYTSIGIGIGILLIKLTGLLILDPLIAIFVAFLIIKEAWHLSKNAFDYIIDSKLSDEEETEIRKIIQLYSHMFVDFHKLKTTKSGNLKLVDFHVSLEPDLTVMEAHELIGLLKKEINIRLKNTRVSIHIDPYQKLSDSASSLEDGNKN